MIRRLILPVCVLLLAALAGWGWNNRVHLQAFPGIVGAYSAKEYCSCRYVSGFPAEYCSGYVKQYVPLSALRDDAEGKRVTARGLGSTQMAIWLGPRQGCQLQALPDPL